MSNTAANKSENQAQTDRDVLLVEIKEALLSADRAQRALAKDDASNGLYYVNGVQDRLKRLLERYPRIEDITQVWVVQRWSQYKLGRAPFSHENDEDRNFHSEEAAQHYADNAPTGCSGDMRYDYVVVPPK